MKNKRKGIEAIKRRYGIAFVAPWVFGVIVFVAVPIITTVLYSLSIVTVGSSGPEMKFVGFSNYYRLLFKNTVYVDRFGGVSLKRFHISAHNSFPLAYIGDNS